MTTTFSALPDSARLWVFPFDRALTPADSRRLTTTIETFIATWTSHGRPVEAAAEIRDDHFLLVAAQIPGGDVSGCGIDALLHALTSVLADSGAQLASGLAVAFRNAAGRVEVWSRQAFKEAAREGRVSPETPVFDASLTLLKALRGGAFEQPAGDTWLARFFTPARA